MPQEPRKNRTHFTLWQTLAVLVVLPCGLAWSQDVTTQMSESTLDLPPSLKTVQETTNDLHLVDARNQITESVATESVLIPTEETFHTPLWRCLRDFSHADKVNARIEFEIPLASDSLLFREIKTIEDLWNSGNFSQSTDSLCALEESGITSLAVCINWRQPKPITNGRWSSDVQVETRGSARQTCLDFDDGTGNLFVVVRLNGDSSDTRWTINFSSDNGATWNETTRWISSVGEVSDIDAAVVAGWLYIGYVAPDPAGNYFDARMRRAYTSDGSIDSAYGYQIVFETPGFNVRDVAVTTNEDNSADQVYCVAITDELPLAADNLLCYSSDLGGLIWTWIPTGIYNASYGLDASWNQDAAENDLVVSYVDNQYCLNVGMLSAAGWTFELYLDFNLDNGTAISAYQDHIIVVYKYVEGSDSKIKYQISYDGGAHWLYWFVAETGNNKKPDVTARRGCGIAVTWQQEAGAFDPAFFSRRPYANSIWTTPVAYNETDVITGLNMSIEWLPPIAGSADAFGTCWIGGISGERYSLFDRTTFTLDIDPDPLLAGSSGFFTVSNAKLDCSTFLGYSLIGLGSTYIAPLQVTLGIAAPHQAGGLLTTDDVGGGEWYLSIPPAASGLNIWFQAVQEENMSNVVATFVI